MGTLTRRTASFYRQGKMPAAAYFTTVPFGLTPNEHVARLRLRSSIPHATFGCGGERGTH